MNKKVVDILWKALAMLVALSSFATMIDLINNFEIIKIIDLIINFLLITLLFSKSIIGLFLITFIAILGIILSSMQRNIILIMQIIVLIMCFPLWVDKFSSKK